MIPGFDPAKDPVIWILPETFFSMPLLFLLYEGMFTSFLLKLQGNSGKFGIFNKNERSCSTPYLLLGYPKDKPAKQEIFAENSLFSMKKIGFFSKNT